MDGKVLLICALCAGIYLGGREAVKVVKGVKKIEHGIVHVFKHKKPDPPPVTIKEGES
jgi:hypothetical protein